MWNVVTRQAMRAVPTDLEHFLRRCHLASSSPTRSTLEGYVRMLCNIESSVEGSNQIALKL